LSAWTRHTSNYNAENGDRIIADTSVESFTVTLPADPVIGYYVQIGDGNDWSTNNLTVAGNGSLIEDINEDLILDIKGAIVEFVYDGTTWEAFASIGTGTSGFVTETGSATITNKRITPRVSAATSITSPLSWNSDSFDQYSITSQNSSLTINADIGTPTDGQRITFRIKDDGTPRSLTFTTGASKSFRALGVTLPTSTVADKNIYVQCVYNLADNRWDVILVAQEA
jgi:hypothetical protein